MLISLFTPTHDPKHITDTYRSVLGQKGGQKYQWIIIPNGGITRDDLPEQIRADPRVKIVQGLPERCGIGALKKFACEQCDGDVFVELDHDDILSSDTFDELEKAYKQEPTGFYYSDFINLKQNGKCETYNVRFGWETYNCVVDGKDYTACRAFTPTARSLCQIFYAPNHVRAWSRSAYEKSKGHDPFLSVGDDHDLVCRTYLCGAPFIWIQKPLYIYRRWDNNSFVKYNKDIQIQQNANCNKYMLPMVLEECRREKLEIVDLGANKLCPSNCTSFDLINGEFKDPLWTYFTNDRIGAFRMTDVLQYVPRDKIVPLINDIYTCLRPGGWLLTATPSVDDGEGRVGRGAFQDPLAVSYWSANNFLYFTDRVLASRLPDSKARFQSVRCATMYPTDFHKKNHMPYVYTHLCALKGQRQPGPCSI